jgi:chromosome partitioning protein
MRTLAISNAKGGVGKTATAHALGAILAAEGLSVLLVDLDPQSSLTQACGVVDPERSIADVLGGSIPGKLALHDVIIESTRYLHLAPADISLAACELGLISRLGREGVLRKAINSPANDFDLVIIDCPPSLGLLTLSALVAADAVLIPTQPQAADLRGLRIFLDKLQDVREINPALDVLGILVTFYDSRLTHHQAAIETMKRAGLPLLPVMVGRSVRVAEASGAGQSITEYSPGNPRAEEYKRLAEVVRSWLKNNP